MFSTVLRSRLTLIFYLLFITSAFPNNISFLFLLSFSLSHVPSRVSFPLSYSLPFLHFQSLFHTLLYASVISFCSFSVSLLFCSFILSSPRFLYSSFFQISPFLNSYFFPRILPCPPFPPLPALPSVPPCHPPEDHASLRVIPGSTFC